MTEIETRRAADPEDLEALAPIVGWAFGGGTSRALEWLRPAGAAHVRVACVQGRVSGGLVEVPMGQWFGGQSVSTLGLAGVAIAPEAHGQGLALGLVRHTLRAARQRGVALATLYPCTFRLYRKAGFELVGSYCRFTLQLRQLTRMPRPAAVEALSDQWQPAVESAYREVARQHNGYLDRGAYVWNRVRRPDLEHARAFGVLGGDGLEGYVYLTVTAPTPLTARTRAERLRGAHHRRPRQLAGARGSAPAVRLSVGALAALLQRLCQPLAARGRGCARGARRGASGPGARVCRPRSGHQRFLLSGSSSKRPRRGRRGLL
jgi:predicted N-acetyltransferase YhbS